MVARLALFLCLLAAIVYAGNAIWQTRQATNDLKETAVASVRAMGLVDLNPKHLSAGFTDEKGTLLADPPKDPSKFADPPALVVGHIAFGAHGEDAEADTNLVDWVQFDKHLSEATGRPVTDTEVENGPSQIDNIRAGKFNIMALHGADVPFLVNNCGYEPIAVLCDDKGIAGNRCDLMVPAKSPLTQASDLKGKTLTCTVPRSIVGYRAAIALLLENQQLRPNVDYYVSWSTGQKASINGVAVDGKYEAAAVSDEKLQDMVGKGKIADSSYKIIYQSDVFPRAAVGYFYNLKPELAAKVRDAVLSYKPLPTPENQKPLRFTPLDYKKDFALVRDIDDQFDPRLEPKSKDADPTDEAVVAPTTAPSVK